MGVKNFKNKVAVGGTVSPKGLGDALQCYGTIRMASLHLPKSDIAFLCPDLKDSFSIFKELRVKAQLIDSEPAGYLSLWHLLASPRYQGRSGDEIEHLASRDKVSKSRFILEFIRKQYEKHLSSYTVDNCLGLFLMRRFDFDGCIIAGHTICGNLYRYIAQYSIFRSIVNGPLVMSPISVSELEYFSSKIKKSLMIRRLKRTLAKFDFIYVRGPYSLKTLRDQLNINEQKLGMALDTGFALHLIHQEISTFAPSRNATKIVVIPRTDYFYEYNRRGFFKPYLDALSRFILWLFQNFDVEITLASLDIRQATSIESIHARVREFLEKHNGRRFSRNLRLAEPMSILDAWELCASANLVITSRMHGGIMALSSGVPTIFILPSSDVKIRDVLSFMGLDSSCFHIDMFDIDSLKAEILFDKAGTILENKEYFENKVQSAFDKTMPAIHSPALTLSELMQ